MYESTISMTLLAEVDVTARAIAIIAAIAGFGKIIWDGYAYFHQAAQSLRIKLWAEDEPRSLVLMVTNKGRRPVFVQRAVLCYQLGGQELTLDLLKKDRPSQDRKLEPFGDSEEFRWEVTSDKIMQFRLGFQEDPAYLYVSLRSRAEEIHRIPNEQVRRMARHILNEFNPPSA